MTPLGLFYYQTHNGAASQAIRSGALVLQDNVLLPGLVEVRPSCVCLYFGCELSTTAREYAINTNTNTLMRVRSPKGMNFFLGGASEPRGWLRSEGVAGLSHLPLNMMPKPRERTHNKLNPASSFT
mmetsp:Transcript_124488/g.311290  ORF Transcript_124488/g.311290 Transcript_124488/m.311290 type:complete len:126 (-) Transcript_124488:273-650(-)